MKSAHQQPLQQRTANPNIGRPFSRWLFYAEGKFITADEHLTGFGLALALVFMATATPQKHSWLYLLTMGLFLL